MYLFILHNYTHYHQSTKPNEDNFSDLTLGMFYLAEIYLGHLVIPLPLDVRVYNAKMVLIETLVPDIQNLVITCIMTLRETKTGSHLVTHNALGVSG